MKRIMTVALIMASVLLSGAAQALDYWVYNPKSYTDSAGNTWDTISDGDWTVCVTASGTSLVSKGEGTPTSVPPFAVEGTGALDLSKPIYSQNGQTQYYFTLFTNSTFWKFCKSQHKDTLRGITSFVAPEELTQINETIFCLAGDLTTVTFDTPALLTIGNRMFSGASSLSSADLQMPALLSVGYEFMNGMSKVTSNVSNWRFDSLTNLQPRVFASMSNVTGNFYFPSAARIAHQTFLSDTTVRGLLFGSENPEGTGLVHVGKDTSGMSEKNALYEQTNVIARAYEKVGGSAIDINKISVAYGVKLNFLVLGKGTDLTIDDYAFSGIYGITNIFFCGDMPNFGTTVFRHLDEKSAAIYIPKDNATYAAAIASVSAPTDAERADFAANHAPGELIGMVNTSSYFSGNANRKQYLAYGNYRQFLNDVITTGHPSWVTKASDPEFYWNCEKTIRDLSVTADTVIAAPDSFVKNGRKYGVSGYTVETATLTGWSSPVAHEGSSYTRTAGTKGTVRITWTWEEVGAVPSFSVSTADPDWTDDSVSLTLEDGSEIPEAVEYGTKIVATPGTGYCEGFPKVRFGSWQGLADGDEVDEDGTLTFTFDGSPRNLVATFSHDWVFDAEANTIWNRRYRLNVTDLGDSKLGVGTSDSMSGTTAAYGNAFILNDGESQPLTELEAGNTLDLRGRVTDSTGETEYTITTIGYRSLGPWKTISEDSRVSTYYPTAATTPGTLTTLVGYAFGASKWDSYPMTNLVMSESSLVTWGDGFASGHRNLYRLVLDCPKVTTLPKDVVNASNTCLKHTDLTAWNLPKVETVKTQAFGNNCTFPNVTGTLDLPAVKILGTQALSPLSGATCFYLGTNGFTVTAIGDYAFKFCNKMERLVLGAKGDVTLGQHIAPSNSVLKTIDFPGRMPVNLSAVLDAILVTKDVSAGAKDYVTVIGSRVLGLASRVEWDANLTADEQANLPEGDAFGIYTTTDKEIRKAYLVGRASPWDRGFILIVR